MKVAIESSSHRQDRIAGAPCPRYQVRIAIQSYEVRCTHTWTDDIQGILVGLTDDSVEVSIDHGQTGARSPVSKESRFDIVGRDVAFYENIVLQEYHSLSQI